MMPKENLLLIPGMLSDELLWQPQIDVLSTEVNIFVGDVTTHETVNRMAESILQQVPEKIAVAGFSMGGLVALEIARQAPERITKLALLDTNPFPLKEDQIAWWDRFMEMVEVEGFIQVIKDRLLPGFVHQKSRHDVNLMSTIIQMVNRVGKEAMFRQIHAIQSGPSTEGLPELAIPTIVIAGREDALCPLRIQNSIIENMPYAELFILEQFGHMSTLEQSKAVTDILQAWLRGKSE